MTLLSGLTAVSVVALVLLGVRPEQDRVSVPPAGEQSRTARAPEVITLTTNDLDRLAWSDIDKAVQDLGADADRRALLAQQLDRTRRPQNQYLRALMLLANDEPHAALLAFNAIGADKIPGVHLYPPYRLHRTLQPGLPSSYRPLLEEAVRAGAIPPLVAARVHVMEGRLTEGLSAYTLTDPAGWTRHDITCLLAVHRHAGLRPDVSTLVRGALRAGRVPGPLRSELKSLLARAVPDATTENNLKSELLQRLRSDETFRRVATEATVRQLEIRRQFASRDYEQLLDRTEDTDPRSVADETALILFLSAAKVAQFEAMDRWSQEIRRRFPTPEVHQWIQTLKPPAP